MSTWKYAPQAEVTIAEHAAGRWTGQVWIVESQPRGARGVNYVLKLKSNPLTKMRCPESLLEPHTPGAHDGQATTTAVTLPQLPEPGTIVKLNIPNKVHPDLLWVVCGDSGRDKSRVFPLGGGLRYWKVSPRFTTEVPPHELAAAMPAHLAAAATD